MRDEGGLINSMSPNFSEFVLNNKDKIRRITEKNSNRNKDGLECESALNRKYSHLKVKLDEISKDAHLLSGEDGKIQLDPNNPHHRAWMEDDE